MKNLRNKITLVLFGIIVALSMVGCGDVGNIQPVNGDSRTVNQMTSEAYNNTKDIAEGGVFNQVWAR